MNAGIRIVFAIAALLLFSALRVLALFRLDRALLSWAAGGSHAAVRAPLAGGGREL